MILNCLPIKRINAPNKINDKIHAFSSPITILRFSILGLHNLANDNYSSREFTFLNNNQTQSECTTNIQLKTHTESLHYREALNHNSIETHT